MKNQSKITCVVSFKVLPGKKEELLKALYALEDGCRNEDGWLGFRILQDMGDENTVVMIEEYRSLEDFQKHFDTPHIQYFMDNIRPNTCSKIFHDKFFELSSYAKSEISSLT